jgi:hypothetical protein
MVSLKPKMSFCSFYALPPLTILLVSSLKKPPELSAYSSGYYLFPEPVPTPIPSSMTYAPKGAIFIAYGTMRSF